MKNRSEYPQNLTRNDIKGSVSWKWHPYPQIANKRFHKGKTIEETLIPPMWHGGRRNYYEYDVSKVHQSLNQKIISRRIQRDRSLIDAITTPLWCRKKRKTETL